ncbi:hypothetical protein [Spirosoma radiotolerans]|uniref:Uncharacterized protein n=1 Tax=Spirosoma radiotolerans TaxID=1379870 RepID=A0A0E3ZXP2_9BACT|nr:hypothetical protein [Spirosoma radiotolerans]AKD57044.1 hypothetical protein SD10_21245 [Spirosoma radiotolerans]
MKSTVDNIKNLWFGADTPIRQNKIKLHPELWAACQRVNQHFTPPSGALHIDQYRKSDRLAFARAVLKELNQKESVMEPSMYDMA